MGYSAKILCDSINPAGCRLTTFEVQYPRMVHSELMTHRMFSRNAASSRAIPVEKMIAAVERDPAGPIWWGKNQPGMQAREELVGPERVWAEAVWLEARDHAVRQAKWLHHVGAHKQIVNRLLEPWMWITVLISATDYGNFFHLRCHEDAQPEIRHIAEWMQRLYRDSVPEPRAAGEWHLPLVGFPMDESLTQEDRIKVCVGRCARVSYLTHTGERDVRADLDLHDRLMAAGHWSPFEHAAAALSGPWLSGNFGGWGQYRKQFPQENAASLPPLLKYGLRDRGGVAGLGLPTR